MGGGGSEQCSSQLRGNSFPSKKKNKSSASTYNLYSFVSAISMEGWGGRRETKILINLVRLMNRRLVTVNVTAEGQLLMFLGNRSGLAL